MVFGNRGKVIFDNGEHKCIMFTELVKGEGIQANQFLIIDGDHEALIDPGGDLTFAPLSLAIGRHIELKNLDYILASHQDPDIIAALGRWMMQTNAKVVCSELWSRFLPHLASSYLHDDEDARMMDRIIGLPDRGASIRLGNSRVIAVPAHFLHSVGNFQFYDVTSKILFSGDMGASLTDGDESEPVEDFDTHLAYMEGFHRRYMCSNRACKLWAEAMRELDIEMIVPQHGRPFVGKAMVNRFLDWIADFKCGVDLLNDRSYRVSVEL